jgi:hypothetical protein
LDQEKSGNPGQESKQSYASKQSRDFLYAKKNPFAGIVDTVLSKAGEQDIT